MQDAVWFIEAARGEGVAQISGLATIAFLSGESP
jgi:hypothetical protein